MNSHSRNPSSDDLGDYQKMHDILFNLQRSHSTLEERLVDLENKLTSSTPKIRLKNLVGAIDQGTTSSRFLIFNSKGEPIASHQVEFKQIYPQPGWHEHDPNELVSSVLTCIDGAVNQLERNGFDKIAIKTIGITNQRETTVVWDTETGEPLHNAIVWTDTRSASIVKRLKSQKGSDELMAKCGLPLSTYPSVTKLLWLLENVPAVKEAYDASRLSFGTVDSWLVYKLNGGPTNNIHVSEPTNASRSMFMNLHSLTYDSTLLSFFAIDPAKLHLPQIVRSSSPTSYGSITIPSSLKGVSITGCLGDQSAALVGQKAFAPGSAKNTYGTGCFLLYNVGPKPVISSHGLLATVAYSFDDTPIYALEGSIAVAGSAVKFLVNNLGLASSSEEITTLASSVDDSGGVVFVTAFSGLFAPYWRDDVKGALLGITQYTSKGHIARAALDAACFQTKAILDAMEKDSGQKLERLAVDGGMSNSDLAMQTQADLIQIPISRPEMRETTALGAAFAAGLAVGVWKDLEEMAGISAAEATVFKPQTEKGEADRLFGQWERAVKAAGEFV